MCDLTNPDPREASSLDPQRYGPETLARVAAAMDSSTLSPDGAGESTGSNAQRPAEGQSADLPAIEGYQILSRLGEGGMGTVWRAIQLSTKREVALKLMHAAAFGSDRARHRFDREIEITAQLQDPNIARIYDSGLRRGTYYYAMELIDGVPLDQYAVDQKMDLRARLGIMATVCGAVQHAHEKGVIHRDLKPANILVDKDSCPHVLDFGLAKSMLADATSISIDGSVAGTPAYMSPEQASGRNDQVNTRSDVYSLGVILFWLATGGFPHEMSGSCSDVLHRISHEDIARPRHLDRDLEAILLKALAREPAERYGSAGELGRDLGSYVAGEMVSARSPTLGYFLRKRLRRQRVPLLVTAGVLALLAILAVLFVKVRHQRLVAQLERSFTQALDAQDWSIANLQQLEESARAVEQKSGTPDEMTARLRARLASATRNDLLSPSLDNARLVGIHERVMWLSKRDPATAKELQSLLGERDRAWEVVFSLKPPFDGAGSHLERSAVKDSRLVVEPDSTQKPVRAVMSREKCVGNVRMEAVLEAGGQGPREIGLVLNGGPRGGYFFKLNQKGMQIWRDNMLLRERNVAGLLDRYNAVRLEVSREDNRLTFIMQNQPPLVFEDPFPIPGWRAGTYGVIADSPVALQELTAMRQSTPRSPSPLEKGDELFNADRVAEARAEYQRQMAMAQEEDAQAVRYKIAVCDSRIGNPAAAEAGFRQLLGERGDRWPRMAGIQLWWICLQQKRLSDADAVVETMTLRGHLEGGLRELAALIPNADRILYLGFVVVSSPRSHEIMAMDAPSTVMRLQSTATIVDMLADDPEIATLLRLNMGKAFHRMGDMEMAIRSFRPLLSSVKSDHWAHGIAWEEYGWAMRLAGRAPEARAAIQKKLGMHDKPLAECDPQTSGLLIELARLNCSTGAWEAAEKELANYFRVVSREKAPDREWSAACLLQGFLFDRRGDFSGAAAAWRRGLRRIDGQGTDLLDDGSRRDVTGLMNWVALAAIGGITNSWTDSECRAFVTRVVQTMAENSGALQLVVAQLTNDISPRFLSSMWRAERGRLLARSLALRDLNATTWQRDFILLALHELARQETVGRRFAAEEDQMVRDVALLTYDAIVGRQLKKEHMLALVVTWNATPLASTVLGWDRVAPALRPELRGPMAYVMGLRYIRLGKNADAMRFFEAALRDAGPESPLRKLAQAELGILTHQGDGLPQPGPATRRAGLLRFVDPQSPRRASTTRPSQLTPVE